MKWLEDPRIFQIAFLGTFFTLGWVMGMTPLWPLPVLLLVAGLTQVLMSKGLRGEPPTAGLRSATISALGLSLLLRTDLFWLIPLSAFLAISSKFLLRWNGKHLFNPTNFGLAALMLLTPHVWCSPSQWGERWGLLALFFLLGSAVVFKALRTDVSFAFLVTWIALKAGRVLYLGQRPEVLIHQLSIGSLILFTFFMISDPKTTPNHRMARIAFGVSVATFAFFLQHQLWWQNTPVWALFLLSPLTPVLDKFFSASPYVWPQQRSPA